MNHLTRFLGIVSILFSITAVASAQIPAVPEEVADPIQQVLRQHGVAGISIAVISDDRIAWSGGVGVTKLSSGVAIDRDTLFQAVLHVQSACAGKPPSLLEPELANEMLTPQLEGAPTGMSLFVHRPESEIFSHTGSNEGFRCMLVASKVGGRGTVIMTNSANGESVYSPILKLVRAWRDSQ